MPKDPIKLKNVISSNKVKIFETDKGVFIGHVESTNIFNNNSSKANIYSIKDTLRDQLLRNYYEIEDIDIQTVNTTLPKSDQTGSKTDYIKQYNADDLGYISLKQIDGFGFLLSDDVVNGLRELSYNTSAYVDYDQQSNIFVYPPSGEISLSGEVGNMLPIYNLSGVSFNYLTEVPTDNIYFDFQSPVAYGNTTNLKNYLNGEWNTESMVSSASTTTEVSATLDNTRSYKKLGGRIDGSLYFTYKHDTSYITDDPTPISNSREFDDYSVSALTLSGSLTDIPMSGYAIESDSMDVSAITDGEDYARKFQYVESIRIDGLGGFNKYGRVEGHKSNVYSVNIKNANVNNNTTLSTGERSKIKKSINNVIRNVIEACTPINTQLAKIYWNGD